MDTTSTLRAGAPRDSTSTFSDRLDRSLFSPGI